MGPLRPISRSLLLCAFLAKCLMRHRGSQGRPNDCSGFLLSRLCLLPLPATTPQSRCGASPCSPIRQCVQVQSLILSPKDNRKQKPAFRDGQRRFDTLAHKDKSFLIIGETTKAILKLKPEIVSMGRQAVFNSRLFFFFFFAIGSDSFLVLDSRRVSKDETGGQ